MAVKIVTSNGQTVQSFEDWKNGGKSPNGSQQAASYSGPQIVSSSGQTIQSFEEWRQNRTSGVTPGGDSVIIDWMDRYNRVMQGVSAYDKKRNGGFTRDASGGFGTEIDSLIADYDGIEGYASEYGFRDAQKYLVQLKKLQNSIQGINDNFSQFEDEDAYNRYMEYWKDQEEKKNLDLDSYSREIAALEQQLEDYDPQIDWTDTNQRKQYDAGLKQLEDEINRRKQYYTQAQRIQRQDADTKRFADIRNRDDFAENSGFDTGNQEIGYRYINGSLEDRLEMERQYGQYVTQFADNAFDSLIDEEKAVYNYYMNTGDRESAAEYLKYVEEDIRDRKAKEIAKDYSGYPAAQRLYGLAEAGPDQFLDYSARGFGNMIRGSDESVSPSVKQRANALMMEEAGNTGKKYALLGDRTMGQALQDLATTTGNMFPSILVSKVISLIPGGQKVGEEVGGLMMGAGAAGSGYQEMINAGYNVDQARIYGIGTGAAEYVIEKLMGGISSLGGGGAKKLAKWAEKVDKVIFNFALRLGGSMGSEGFEEGIQEVFSGWLKSEVTHEDFYAKPVDVMYASLLGMASGGLFEGPSIISDISQQSSQGRKVKQSEGVDMLKEMGKASSDSATRALADRISSDSGNFAVGKLARKVESETGKQNSADIAKSLTQKGMPEKAAKQYGEMLSYMLEAGSDTEVQRMVMESDPVVGQTLREAQMPDSAVYQRLQNMSAATGKARSIDRVAALYGKQAEAVKQIYAHGQQTDGKKQDVETFAYGFQRAYTIGRENGNAAALTEEIAPGLTQIQRELAYDLGRDAVAAEKAAASKRTTGKESAVHILNEDGSMGDEVRIAEISSRDGDSVTYVLEDGRTVSEDQLSFSGDNAVLDTVKDLGLDVQTANIVIRGNKTITKADTLVAHGIDDAFRYGSHGYSMERLAKDSPFAALLTEEMRTAVYNAGKNAPAAAEKKPPAVKVKTRGKNAGIYYDAGGGDVKVYRPKQFGKLEHKRESGVYAAQVLQKLGIGVDFYFFRSYVNSKGERVYLDVDGMEQKAPNGWYDKSDGSIHIDLNAGNDGQGLTLFTMAHELTHFIEQWSPEKYKVLADFLIQNYEKGRSMDELVLIKQQALSAGRKKPVSYEEAYSEVIADSMEAMLADGSVMDKLRELKAQDSDLVARMKEFFDRMVKRITKYYQGLQPESEEGKLVLEMKDQLEQIQQLFAEALVEAGENFQAADGQKNTAQEGRQFSDRKRKGMDDSEISAVQNIGRISVNAFTSQDIKATEKLARRYWEEMGVKSPFFRAWFGDWRANDQTPVKIADQKGDTRGVQRNDDTGWDITVSGQVFNETKSHRGLANKSAQPYLPYINDIVRKAVLLDSYGVGVGKAKSDNSLLMHSMYAVANIGNGPEVLKLYVEEMNNPTSDLTTKRSYQLQNIEKAFNASVRVQGQAPSSLTSTLNAVKIVADLFAAVKRYDTAFAPNPVSKAINADGTPLEMYHGTSKSGFTVFNTYSGKFGLFGKGSYFTDNPEVADSYTHKGKGQEPGVYGVYLSIKNPLDMDAHADLNAWKKAFENADLDPSYLDGVVTNEDAFRQLKENLADEEYLRWEAEDLVTELIEGMGYDGITHIGGGRYGSKDGPKHRVYIAFEPEQIKSSTDNIGTFDGSNPDIRYQDRATGTSNRDLLAGAFEELARNPDELEFLREYQENVGKLNEQEQKLQEIRTEIREISFGKGPRDTKRLQQLQEEATKTANRINIYDKRLLGLEAAVPLQRVLDRERKKVKQKADADKKAAMDRLREETTAAYEGVRSDAEVMEREFIRLMRAYEKQTADSASKAQKAQKDIKAKQETIDSYKADLQTMEREFIRVMKGYETAERRNNASWEGEFKRLMREYEASGRKIDHLEAKINAQRESVRANVDSRRRTVLRNKIRKDIRELDKILNRGNKKRNVKQGMQDFVSKAIATGEILFANLESDTDLIASGIQTDMTADERKLLTEAERYVRQIAELEGNEAMADVLAARQKGLDEVLKQLQPVLQRERIRINSADASSAFDALVASYESLQESPDAHIAAAFNPDALEYLKSVKHKFAGTLVKDMSQEQLQTLHKCYKMVMTMIRDANKAFVDGRSVQADAEQLVQEFQERKIPEKKVGIILRNLSNAVGWNYEKLYYALERINSPTLKRLYQKLADSENITMQDVQEAKAFQMEMVEKYHYNDWKIDQKMERTFLDNNGKEFHLTLGELMALYAYSRREGADRHIEVGGFTIGKNALTDPEPASTYKLTADQVAAISDLLTPEQKTFAEAMQRYLSRTMGSKGNEVSLKLYGIEMFGEENYFPLHIAGEYKARAQESQAKAEAGFQSMTNAGFTKARNANATAPIVLEDFMTVWADHVNEMSRYHGAVPALEDIRRVMNYSVYSDAMADSVSVQAAMTNAYGKQAVQYFDSLYREANSGAVTDKMDATSKKMLSAFRKNSVAYSASVVIQQPASIYRAKALIDGKYFGKHGFFTLTGGVLRILNRKKWNASYAEMMKYAPGVTMAKEIGGFDTSTGSSIRSYLLDTDRGFRQSMKHGTLKQKAGALLNVVDDNVIANLPNVADKIAWIEIWEACRRETVANNPKLATSSEEFKQKVGQRFTEVIRATQVYDSMFSKSPMLKSKNLAVQYVVSFMNEPNTVANMAEKALRDVLQGNVKTAGKAIGALATSIVVTNLLKSIIYAIRDEDDDETFMEKYLSAVAGNLTSDVNPLNYIPYARDVWSIWQGYDVERADMAVIADAVNAIRKLQKLNEEDVAKMSEEELEAWDKKVMDAQWRVAETLSPIAGIPLKNIRREVLAVINAVKIRDLDKSRESTELSIRHAIEEATGKADRSDRQKLYEALLAGDRIYADRLKAGYESDTAYHSAIKLALRDNDSRIWEAAIAWNADDLDTYMSIATEIIGEKHFIQDDIVMAIRNEAGSMEENESSSSSKVKGYFTNEKFGVAMGQNNTGMADVIRKDLIDTKVANGKTREEAARSVESTARSQLKELFDAGSITGAAAEKLLVRYGGYDQEEAADKVADWKFETEYGFTYSDRSDAYKNGEISQEELRSILMDVGGKTREEADLQIQVYDWEAAGYDGATFASVRDYNEHCARYSVPKDVYLHIKKVSNNTKNDVDSNGKTIYYSAMKKVMAEIGAQYALTSAQKYAIARSLGWSEKNIEKYKTWY